MKSPTPASLALACGLALGTTASAADPASPQDFHLPSTVSPQAKAYFQANFSRATRDSATFPTSGDKEEWKRIQAEADLKVKAANEAVVRALQPDIRETKLGGVPVLDIRPRGWQDNGKVLVHAHGGAYVIYHPATMLTSTAPMATDSGMRVVSVDYTLAPFAQYEQVFGEMVAVVKALLADGRELKDIALYGESAGGGLAAATALKLRDDGVGLVGAVVLWSPWSDITDTGDTYFTLKDHEPTYLYAERLAPAAAAYAKPEDQKHPYVSPVYGDFKKGYPPTLIQVGTKEIFLSNAVRLYQAIETAGQTAKLDVYEGMWHVFQIKPYDSPEAQLARKKSAAFLKQHLQAK